VQDPARDADINVVGTVKVLEAAQRAGARVVFTSSGGAIYGECLDPALEWMPRVPGSPYGISKLCGEEYLTGFNRIHGASNVVARLGNVYGPRQSPTLEGGVVSIFLDRMHRGEQTVIFGDGLQVRDFVYVGDVVEALLAAGAHEGGVFNVGSGDETTVLDLHRACAAVAGVTAEPRFEPARLGDLRRSSLDVSLAAGELGFRARTTLAEGLAHTWAWTTGP
jgi:UDP-glucose 4-epimerase